MSPEAPVEDGIRIGRREIAQGLLALTVVAAVSYAIEDNLGAIEGVEPIKVPADAALVSMEKDPLKVFEVPSREAAAVYCGHVAIELGDDFVPPKIIIPVGGGNSIVDCDTRGAPRPIPIEHAKPPVKHYQHHKPASKGHKSVGKHKHHKSVGKR